MDDRRYALEVRGVTKRFPGVTALSDVNLRVLPGEIHALVGENGAGKSTLMSVSSGALAPDEGSVTVMGQPLTLGHPDKARELGLAIVYQHPALLPDLSVAENFALAAVPSKRRPVRQATAWASQWLDQVGARVHPRARIDSLSIAERQLVEIARALSAEPSVLVLDEPTEALTREAINVLFDKIRSLRASGTAIVYISHRIPDVKEISDRITVLRDGQIRGTFDTDDVDEGEIVRLIVGRTLSAEFPDKWTGQRTGPPVLAVQGFSGDRFSDVSLEVHNGEIVGLAGIEGNGQKEFLRALAGLESAEGAYQIAGVPVGVGSVQRALAAGVVYTPGDRGREGLFPRDSVRVNTSTLALDKVSTAGFISSARENAAVTTQVRSLAIKTPTLDTPIAALSGGNQQKVILGRALLTEPRVLLADEPTQGVDAGARAEMYRILRETAQTGGGVLVLSSDALELAGLCDRVVIFSRGHAVRELTGSDVTESNITETALTATTLRRGEKEAKTGGRFGPFLAGDLGPAAVLGVAILALAFYTFSRNGLFLSGRNIAGLLFLAATLMFIAQGQMAAIVTGGIDLSVGPLVGLLVVIGSYVMGDASGVGGILMGLLLVIVVALLVGFVNAFGFRRLRLNPIVSTLVTFTVITGVALLLRPTADGRINSMLVRLLGQTVGGIPIMVLAAVVTALLLEWGLRYTRAGLRLRAVGSDEGVSRRLGVPVERAFFGAYMFCSFMTAIGALLVMASVGIGEANAGSTYTFASITAVILAGTAIAGGRGSFIATILGALLIQMIYSATGFLGLSDAWQFWLTGGLMLVAAGVYSLARKKPIRLAPVLKARTPAPANASTPKN